jgi:hypothetical protein
MGIELLSGDGGLDAKFAAQRGGAGVVSAQPSRTIADEHLQPDQATAV